MRWPFMPLTHNLLLIRLRLRYKYTCAVFCVFITAYFVARELIKMSLTTQPPSEIAYDAYTALCFYCNNILLIESFAIWR